MANVPGMFVTVGGAWMLQTFGSWLPLFFGVAGFQVLGAAMFATVAQVTPPVFGPKRASEGCI